MALIGLIYLKSIGNISSGWITKDNINYGVTGSLVDGCRFIEKFNRDMMDQFLDYQRRVVASQIRWEQERTINQ